MSRRNTVQKANTHFQHMMPNIGERWGTPPDDPAQTPYVVPTPDNNRGVPPSRVSIGSANPIVPPMDPLEFSTNSWETGGHLGITLPSSVDYGVPFPGGSNIEPNGLNQYEFDPQGFQSPTGQTGNAYVPPSTPPLFPGLDYFAVPQALRDPQQAQANIGHLQQPRVVARTRGTYHRVTFGDPNVDAALSFGTHGPGFFVPDDATSPLHTASTPLAQTQHVRRDGMQGASAPMAYQTSPEYYLPPSSSTSPWQQAGFVQGSSQLPAANSLPPAPAAQRAVEQSVPKTKKAATRTRKRSRTAQSGHEDENVGDEKDGAVEGASGPPRGGRRVRAIQGPTHAYVGEGSFSLT